MASPSALTTRTGRPRRPCPGPHAIEDSTCHIHTHIITCTQTHVHKQTHTKARRHARTHAYMRACPLAEEHTDTHTKCVEGPGVSLHPGRHPALEQDIPSPQHPPHIQHRSGPSEHPLPVGSAVARSSVDASSQGGHNLIRLSSRRGWKHWFFFFFFFFFFVNFWLHWVFVAAHGLSLAAATRGYSSLQSMGSRQAGLVAPQHVGSSWTRDQIHTPCVGSTVLTTGPPGKFLPHKVPPPMSSKYLLPVSVHFQTTGLELVN